jgi:uncharacterized Zn-binding protein involved in type VI secretion
MQPVAIIPGNHVCPIHIGGVIAPLGVPKILVKGMPIALVGDICICPSPIPNMIIAGSTKVFVGGRPVARVGDPTAHGGTLTVGIPTVLIG